MNLLQADQNQSNLLFDDSALIRLASIDRARIIAFVGPTRAGKSYLSNALCILLGIDLAEAQFMYSDELDSCTVGVDFLTCRIEIPASPHSQNSPPSSSPASPSSPSSPSSSSSSASNSIELIILDVEGGDSVSPGAPMRHAKLLLSIMQIASVIIYTSPTAGHKQTLDFIGRTMAQVASMDIDIETWPSLFLVSTPAVQTQSKSNRDDFLQRQISSSGDSHFIFDAFPLIRLFCIPRNSKPLEDTERQTPFWIAMEELKKDVLEAIHVSVPKTLNGQLLSGPVLASFLKDQCETLRNKEIPEPVTGMEGVARVVCSKYFEQALIDYDVQVPNPDGMVEDSALALAHKQASFAAISTWKTAVTGFLQSKQYPLFLHRLNIALSRRLMGALSMNTYNSQPVGVSTDPRTRYEDERKEFESKDTSKGLFKNVTITKFRVLATKLTEERTRTYLRNGREVISDWKLIERKPDTFLRYHEEKTETGGILGDIAKVALLPVAAAVDTVTAPVGIVSSVVQGRSIDWLDVIPLAKSVKRIGDIMKGGRVLVYDDTEGVNLQGWWKAGEHLEKVLDRFDFVIRAKSWDSVACQLIAISKEYGPLHEVQYWGHGSPGIAWIGNSDTLTIDSLKSTWSQMSGVMDNQALVWFRTCSTFRDEEGRQFATAFASALGCRVAAHTVNIDTIHDGLVWLDPGVTAKWGEGKQGIKCYATDMSLVELGN